MRERSIKTEAGTFNYLSQEIHFSFEKDSDLIEFVRSLQEQHTFSRTVKEALREYRERRDSPVRI